MESIEWNNQDELYFVSSYLHDLVHACNPQQESHLQNMQVWL